MKATLSLAFVAAIVGCQTDHPNGEINWNVYTEGAETAHLESGGCVSLFVYAEMSEDESIRTYQLNATRLKQLCPDDEYVAFLLKWDEFSDPRHIISQERSVFQKNRSYFLFAGR